MARLTDATVASLKAPASGQAEHPDGLITGLRLRIGKTGRKTWIVRTRAGQKILNKALGTYPVMRLADAREAARDLLLDIAKNGAPREQHTFGDLVDVWVKRHAQENNSSWQQQKRRLEIHVLPHWRDKPVDEIRRADVIELIERVSDVGGDIVPNRVLTLIKTLLRFAIARDWIDASPADAVRKPKDEAPRDRYLSETEIKRVWRAAELLGYPFAGYVRMLLLTAQRRTEVATMRWSDIDLAKGDWIIPTDQTKSARAHLVPLPSAAVALLEALPRLGDYVFTSDGESPVSGFAKAKQRLDRYIEATGETIEAWRFHDLRRTAATHLGRLGIAEGTISKLLNHAPAGVTNRVYNLYASASEKRVALEEWTAEINRIAAGNGGAIHHA